MENRELDGFFEPGPALHSVANPPPPPAGVDTREFHSSTAGGFGNMPSGAPSGGPALNLSDLKSIDLKSLDFKAVAATLQVLVGQAGEKLSQLSAGAAGGVAPGSSGGGDQAAGGGASMLQQLPFADKFGSVKPWREFAMPIGRPADSAVACYGGTRW
eukprot:g13762.t1